MVGSTVILTAILKTDSYHRGVLAPEGRDINCGSVLPSDLGLQGQRYMNGAAWRDDSRRPGAGEQHGGRVLTHLVGETSQRNEQAPGTGWDQQHVRLFQNKRPVSLRRL